MGVVRMYRCAGADLGGGGFGSSSTPFPNLEWADLQCAHTQRHVITILVYSK